MESPAEVPKRYQRFFAWVVVAALVAAVASFAGLVITTLLVWLAVRRARAIAAIESALRRQDRIDGRIAAR
jgi:hypothetical protein